MTHNHRMRQTRISPGLLSQPVRIGLSALLLLTSGSIFLSPQIANTTPTLTAQIPASATIIYVNPETGTDTDNAGISESQPFKTITYALGKAQANTVIQLAPGSYTAESGETFPLAIKPGVILRGDEANKGQTTAIIGSGVFISPTFARQNITIRAGNDSTISGVTVTNPSSRGTAVWVESTNPTITNCTFSNSKREGVYITGTGNPKIENNVFAGNAGNGIALVRSAQGEIRNNLFQDTGFAIAIGDQSAPTISDNRMLKNTGGIVVNGSAKPTLRNNIITDSKRHGIVVTAAAQPDLGTADNPGKNLIRNNGLEDKKKFFDALNATKTIKIMAVGNDIDSSRISGEFEFVAAKVDEPPLPRGATAFSDVQTSFWARTYIEALASRNIIAGFPNGTFRPNEPVTRAQFAAIIAKAFTPAAKRESTVFKDVQPKFWGYEVIQTAYQGGFVSGYPDRTFKPEQQIPRVQALVSLATGLNLTADQPDVLSFFTDAGQIPNYATNAIAAATQRQLVVNYPTVKQLNPNRPATRAEVAAFVYQALVNAQKADALPSPYLVRVP